MATPRSLARSILPVGLRAQIHWALVRNRWFSELFANLDPRMKTTRVTDSTRLVIDGFPRSGNSYSRAAFLYANGENTPISTHRHSPRSVEAGLRHGIPVIVLLRPPRPAIASQMQYEPLLDPNRAIDFYRWFYEGILPVADDVLIETFADVTADFGEVIRRCNRRFGTDFIPYQRTPEAEAAVAEMVDLMASQMFEREDLGNVVARPSPTRQPPDEVLATLDGPTAAKLADLDALHDEVLRHRWSPHSDPEPA